MTFKEKIAKAFHLRTYTHSRVLQAVPRALHLISRKRQELVSQRETGRLQKRRQLLTIENLRRGIDPEALKSIQALGDIQDRPDVFWTKYLDVDKWLEVNIRHAEELGLLAHPPSDVLDLGCGAGYFLVVCRALGARTLGLDVKTDVVLNRMIELFHLERITKRIRPMVKLPDLRRRFDLITGFMICFNFPTNETYWSEKEWDFFLNDLLAYLKPGGRMFFSLNKQPDGEHYNAALKQYFLSRGAVIKGKRVLFNYEELQSTSQQSVAVSAA